jgi:hypothetical protein
LDSFVIIQIIYYNNLERKREREEGEEGEPSKIIKSE